jgi:arylsulfatase A-like enzyme
VSVLLLTAHPAAACGTPASGPGFAVSVRTRLRCEGRRAFGLVATCADPAVVCAAEVDRIAALVFDGVTGLPPTGLRREKRCQRALASLAVKYVGKRVTELGEFGRRRARAAERLLRRAVERCADVPVGGPIPTVGDACAPLASPFDPARAPACVRATLEAITQDAVGRHLEPNVLFVVTDDQRSDTLDVMPVVSELAARGIRFTDAFTSTSLCCPDRASLLTGLYAHNHGVRSNAGAIDFDHDRDTIARQLQENAGYVTALVGKYMVGTGAALGATVPPGWNEWHVFTSDGGFTPYGLYYGYQLNTNGQLASYGLDEDGRFIPEEYSTDLLRDRALGLIDRWAARPFFVEYAPFAPHTPAIPADRHAGTFALLPPARPPSYLEPDITAKPQWVNYYRFLFLANTGDPAGNTDRGRIAQLESLLAVDEAVAALTGRLEAQGLTDNTMVVFTSDNGLLWLEHWLTLKNYPYEESIRLPLVVRYPVLAPAPRTTSAMALPIDFYPTLAELAGIAGQPVNGESLVGLLRGNATAWRDDILLEHFAPVAAVATSTGVRTTRWKLIETDAPNGVTTELYDLAADPFELANVAADPANAAVLAALRARLTALAAE